MRKLVQVSPNSMFRHNKFCNYPFNHPYASIPTQFMVFENPHSNIYGICHLVFNKIICGS